MVAGVEISTVVVTGGVAVVVSFWGWLAVKVVDQGRKLVELEERINAQQRNCDERLTWMREMATAIKTIGEDTAATRAALGVSIHA